jgi:maltose O-acetyltransferase
MTILRRLCVSAFNSIQASGFVIVPARVFLLRMAGMKAGAECRIFEGVYCGSPRRLTLGDRVFINARCFLDGCDRIQIESNVYLAMNVSLITSTHSIGPSTCRAGAQILAPVSIKKGCWIGANSTILPGVAVAQGCIVAAGSVVTKDTDPDGLYAGVPARRIRDLNPHL